MPYVSDAQRKYFNANRSQMEAQGVNVDEWNKATKGLKLPARVNPKKRKPRTVAVQNSPAATMLGLSGSPMHPVLGVRR
ncbi:MAG TPA: hypothetical protein VNG33_03265 [Polyangiaceae bacterium]|nr:hypothetical protein [Polyangiaceae bacterium]